MKYYPRKYYFAYGANCNINAMATRCPAAESLGGAVLRQHSLVFKNVADILVGKGAVQGVLWAISSSCELSLDQHEGFPHLYQKKHVTIDRRGRSQKAVQAMTYYLRQDLPFHPPGRTYFNQIKQGYQDFNLDLELLYEAVWRSEIEFYEEIEIILRSEYDYST